MRQLTIAVYEVCEVEVQFAYRDAYVVWVDAEVGVHAAARLLQPLPVGALQRDGLEENHHDKVKPPHLVCLSKAVDSSHFAFLVGVAENTHSRPLASDAQYKVFATFLCDVLSKFGQ